MMTDEPCWITDLSWCGDDEPDDLEASLEAWAKKPSFAAGTFLPTMASDAQWEFKTEAEAEAFLDAAKLLWLGIDGQVYRRR